jgi:hypothetical protein
VRAALAIAGLTSAAWLFRHLVHRVARLTTKDRR